MVLIEDNGMALIKCKVVYNSVRDSLIFAIFLRRSYKQQSRKNIEGKRVRIIDGYVASSFQSHD